LSMVASFALITTSAPGVEIAPVVLAALTASATPEPEGMTTWTPDSSVTKMGVLLVLTADAAGISVAAWRAAGVVRGSYALRQCPFRCAQGQRERDERGRR
jgi:hypothetical protein